MTPDHYATLGVSPTATAAEIRAAYLALMREYHPDRNREPEAVDRAQAIIAAFKVLGHFDQRNYYDWDRRREREAAAAAGPARTGAGLAQRISPGLVAGAIGLAALGAFVFTPVAGPEPKRTTRPVAEAPQAVTVVRPPAAVATIEPKRVTPVATIEPKRVTPERVTPERVTAVKVAAAERAAPVKVTPVKAPALKMAAVEVKRVAPARVAKVEVKTVKVASVAKVERPPVKVAERAPVKAVPTKTLPNVAAKAPVVRTPAAPKSPPPVRAARAVVRPVREAPPSSADIAALDQFVMRFYGQSWRFGDAPKRAALERSRSTFVVRRGECSADLCRRSAYLKLMRDVSQIVETGTPPIR